VRTHGWAGNPPSTDAEAYERIVDGASACIDRVGADFDMAMVASEIGITRQTLYRYFANRDALIAAATTRAGVPFVERLLDDLVVKQSDHTLVDAMLFCLDEMPRDPQLSVLFAPRTFNPAVVSNTAMRFALTVIDRLPDRGGVPAERSDAVVELVVRLLQSLLSDPATATRDRADVRRFLTLVVSPQVT